MLPIPLSLSAPNAAALRGQAARLRAQLADRPEVDLLDVGYSLATASTAFEHRAVVVAGDRGAFLRGLDALSQGQAASGVVRGVAGTEDRVVFVFPGQGAHWAGMAVELMASSEVFRESIRSCAQAFAPFVDWSLEEVLSGEAEAPGLDRVDVVQPVLFAVMVSLAAVWRFYGVEPAAVVGHSLGEIAAATVAGGLSLEDGARVVTLWSQGQARLSGRGVMAAVFVVGGVAGTAPGALGAEAGDRRH